MDTPYSTAQNETQTFEDEIKNKPVKENKEQKTGSLGLTIGIIAIIVVMTILIFMTVNFVRIQMGDLSNSLSVINKEQEGNKSLHMLVKYMTITQNQRQQESEQAYLAEVMWQSSLPEINNNVLEQTTQEEWWADKLTRWMIGRLRLLIGKTATRQTRQLFDNIFLQRAYVYERMRKYEKAIFEYKRYFDYFPNNRSEDLAVIYLHQAFVKAQLGNYNQSLALLKTIQALKLPPDNPITHKNNTQETSKQLYTIINRIKLQLEMIENQAQGDLLVKGIQYFSIGAYQKSIDTLYEFKDKVDSIEPYKHFLDMKCEGLIRADFYIGRAFEELGMEDESQYYFAQVEANDGEDGVFTNRVRLRAYVALTVYSSQNEHVQQAANVVKQKAQSFIAQAESFISKERSFSQFGSPVTTQVAVNVSSVRDFSSSVTSAISSVPAPPPAVPDVSTPMASASAPAPQLAANTPAPPPVAPPPPPPPQPAPVRATTPPPAAPPQPAVQNTAPMAQPTSPMGTPAVQPMNDLANLSTLAQLETNIQASATANEELESIVGKRVQYIDAGGEKQVRDLVPVEGTSGLRAAYEDPKTGQRLLLQRDTILHESNVPIIVNDKRNMEQLQQFTNTENANNSAN